MKASAPDWMKPILEWFHATMRDLDSLPGSSRTAHSQKAASHRLDRTTRLGWTSHALDRFVERWCPGDRGRAKIVLYDRLAAAIRIPEAPWARLDAEAWTSGPVRLIVRKGVVITVLPRERVRPTDEDLAEIEEALADAEAGRTLSMTAEEAERAHASGIPPS